MRARKCNSTLFVYGLHTVGHLTQNNHELMQIKSPGGTTYTILNYKKITRNCFECIPYS